MSTSEAWNMADIKAGLRATFNNCGEDFHSCNDVIDEPIISPA